MVHMCQGFAFAGDVHRGGQFDAVRIERLFDQIIFARIGMGMISASTPCIRWCHAG